MDLNFFRNIKNTREENQSNLKELTDMLEKSFSRTEIEKSSKINDISLLQQVQNNQKVTVMFRDKMHMERARILEDYAKETFEKGEMYFVYNKNSQLQDGYDLVLCNSENTHEVIQLEKDELPVGAGVDSVLRKDNDKYVLDELGTNEVLEKMKEMVNSLLNEQAEFLKAQRIEGHVYEVGEIESDRVWLFDLTKDDGNGIEEIDFPEELLGQVIEGTKIKFENEKYSIIG